MGGREVNVFPIQVPNVPKVPKPPFGTEVPEVPPYGGVGGTGTWNTGAKCQKTFGTEAGLYYYAITLNGQPATVLGGPRCARPAMGTSG